MNDTSLVNKEYWDEAWAKSTIPAIMDPKNNSIGNVINRARNEFFHSVFDRYIKQTNGKKLIEVGCGNSEFLLYLNREFEFDISGLDYSEIGCKKIKNAAEHYGIDANIVCCNLFDPCPELKNAFDVVVSWGVIEHFEDTSAPCRAMYDLLKSGGIVLTVIPNFSIGSNVGRLQKFFAPEIYAVHVPLDVDDVRIAHEKSGFYTELSEYLLSRDYGVINYNNKHNILSKMLIRFGKIIMLIKKNKTYGTKKNSPYIVYIGRKN